MPIINLIMEAAFPPPPEGRGFHADKSMKTQSNKLSYFLMLIILLGLTACGKSQPKLTPLNKGDVILAFGDSLTYGMGALSDNSYPRQLQQMIGHKVINAGIPGEVTSNALSHISHELDANVRLVIICLGRNDMLRSRPHAEIKEDLKKIVQIVQQSGAQVALIAMPEPGYSTKIPSFYEQLGRELNIPVDTQILPKLMQSAQFKEDHVHLSKTGYGPLAQAVAEFLDRRGAIR